MTQCYGLEEEPQLKYEMISIADNWASFRSTAVKYLLAWRNYLKRK